MQTQSDLIKSHFLDPQNVGEVENPSGVGRAASFECGASVQVSLAVSESQLIADARFKAAGCSVLIAVASFLTERIKNMSTGEAAVMARSPKIAVIEPLPNFPADRRACAELVCEALLSAITQYSDQARTDWEGDDALICTCFCVSERTIESVVHEQHVQSVAEVTRTCRAGAGCRSCCPLIQDMIDDYWREQRMQSAGSHTIS